MSMTTATLAPAELLDLAASAAHVAAPLVPAAGDLEAGTPQDPAQYAGAPWKSGAVATLAGPGDAVVGVLVAAELAEALASAPSGALDLGAALQPALDAAAAALGTTAGPGETLSGRKLSSTVKAAAVAVPLQHGAEVAAVLFVGNLVPTAAGAAAPAGVGSHPVPSPAAPTPRGVELLHGVSMEVTVELGRTRLSVRELLALTPGDVLELDRAAGSPADLLVNGRLIARGEVVVVDEDFALRVTEIVAPSTAG